LTLCNLLDQKTHIRPRKKILIKRRLKIQLRTFVVIFSFTILAIGANLYYSYNKLSFSDSKLESAQDLYWKATISANIDRSTLQLEIDNLNNKLSLTESELTIAQQSLEIANNKANLLNIAALRLKDIEGKIGSTSIDNDIMSSPNVFPALDELMLKRINVSPVGHSGMGGISLPGSASVTFAEDDASASTADGAASLTISGSSGASTASATVNLLEKAASQGHANISPTDTWDVSTTLNGMAIKVDSTSAVAASMNLTGDAGNIIETTSDLRSLQQLLINALDKNKTLQKSIHQLDKKHFEDIESFNNAMQIASNKLANSQGQLDSLTDRLTFTNSALNSGRVREHALKDELKKTQKGLADQLSMMSTILLILLAFTVVFGFMVTDAIKKSIKYIQQLIKGKRPKKLNFISKDFSYLINEVTALRNKLEGNQHIEQFLFTMAHEMRTPIASIGANSKNLQELGNKMSDDQIDLAISDINTTSTRMGALVERLLELAKIDNISELESPEKLNLNNMIHKVMMRHSYKMAEAMVTCDYQGTQQEITGESLLAEQALMNILDNAINYSGQNGIINIDVTTNQDEIILTVTNQGRAMTEPVIKAVFSGDTYYSEANPLTGQKGNGLGLRFVKAIMKLHQGSLKITSTETPPSTTVSLIFPLS